MGNCFSSQHSSPLVNTNQGPVGVMGTGMTSLHSHVGPQVSDVSQMVNEVKVNEIGLRGQPMHLQGNPLGPGMPLQGLGGPSNQVIPF